MKRYVSYTIVLAVALTSGLVSCGKKGKGDELASFDVAVSTAIGCPDLSSFHNGLARMPDGWVRTHTVNMTSEDRNTKVSSEVTHPGSPRPNFLSMLFYSNFEMHEQRTGDFKAGMEGVQQMGCSKVLIGNKEYEIKEHTSNSIKLAQIVMVKDRSNADNKVPFEKETLTYVFRSPRSVDIISRHLAQDPCPHYDTVFVTKTTRLTWGHDNDPAASEPQEVNPSFVRRATKAMFNPPSSAASVEGDGLVAMNIDEMKQLRNWAVRRDMQVCPHRAKPSTGDDPEVEIDPTLATPTPAPETEATPAPVQ